VEAIRRRLLAGLIAGMAALVPAPVATASITPSVTVSPSTVNAGSSVQFGTDLKFSPSSGDSPKDLTLILPPGVLSDASIAGGACLQSATPIPQCQVGTGTVTVSPGGGVPISLAIEVYLVVPPRPADLAGLATVLSMNGTQLGSPGEVTIRPSGDPAGVGVTVKFTNLPNTLPGGIGSLSLLELQSTLTGVRMPTSCAPARVGVTVDSYDDSTPKSASAPLTVTNCSSLPFTAAFRVTAVKDSRDDGVQVTTDVTQPAVPAQATSRTVRLTMPGTLAPNAAPGLNPHILCSDPTFATCTPIGSAVSTSPLYPIPLSGKVFLTGQFLAGLPGISIVFPAPFPLVIRGVVDLASNSTTFSNVPDTPVTDLKVSLFGGPDAAFVTSCMPPSGTGTAALTSQNGDQTRTVSSTFTIARCGTSAHPRVVAASLSGLARGRPALRLKLASGRGGPRLRSFAIRLPRGLSVVRHRVRHRLVVVGVSLRGARVRSLSVLRGRLVVTLRLPVSGLTIIAGPKALKENAALRARARRHRAHKLRLTIVITDATGGKTTLSKQVRAG
jgi:hypothetical protein